MKLLLDEMISPRLARDLRAAGYDVQAIKRDRPDLASQPDREIVRLMALERRVIVTNNVADFQSIHDRLLATGTEHHGMLFTFDTTLPRSKAAIPQWVQTLAGLLDELSAEDALRDRVRHLP